MFAKKLIAHFISRACARKFIAHLNSRVSRGINNTHAILLRELQT